MNRMHSSASLRMLLLAVLAVLTVSGAGPLAAGASGPDSSTAMEPAMPDYDTDGQLLLPETYRQWVFVGSSLGLSYTEGELSHEMFHHTLMEPTAYRHYAEHGDFRDGTMLVLMLHGTGEGVLPGRQGRFAADIHGVEMAVKDSRRAGEEWAYYGFGGMSGIRNRAEAFPQSACHSCHSEHAAQDNVFLQFYPLLAEAAPTAIAAANEREETSGMATRAAVDPDDSEPAEAPAESPEQGGGQLALGGLDPVLLAEGREELGKPEIEMVREGFRYQFVSEPTRARFEAAPKRFSIQNETCPVVPGAPANPALYAVHDGRIYVFATPSCVEDFVADPELYLEEVP